MRRVTIALLTLGLLVGSAIAATGGTRSGSEPTSIDTGQPFIRWDLPHFVGNVIVAGGTDVSTDAATGDTIELTGSGHAEPGEAEAAGGGTFVHKSAEGDVRAEGAFYVTGFISWERLEGGSLNGLGLIDGIGNGPGANPNEQEPTSGVLKMRVTFVAVVDGTPQPGVNGVLIVNCHLPGTIVFVQEGVRVKVRKFDLNFKPTSGVTLFHALR